MSVSPHLQEFPIGFAEQMNFGDEHMDENAVFYVEWLEDNSEFPELATNSNQSNLPGGSWELLQRKEANDEDNNIVLTEEDESWAKLDAAGNNEILYSNVVEKNAAELQPTERTIQPLWSNLVKERSTTNQTTNTGEDSEQYPGYELQDNYKSQSRKAARNSKKHLIRDLKTVDFYVEGILSMALTRDKKGVQRWVPSYETSDLHLTLYEDALIKTKRKAMAYSSKFIQNGNKYSYKQQNFSQKRMVFADSGEFSVNDHVVKIKM